MRVIGFKTLDLDELVRYNILDLSYASFNANQDRFIDRGVPTNEWRAS